MATLNGILAIYNHMAEGDKYYNCTRADVSLQQAIRQMIVENFNSDPMWRVREQLSDSTYYLRQILPDNAANNPPQMDGANLVSYGGDLYLMFGWLGGSVLTNKVWKSTDLGKTWTAEPNAPVSSAEVEIALRADGKLWAWPTYTENDVYKYDGTWTLVNNNCPTTNSPIKILFNDKMLIFGSQSIVSGSPVNDTNVYRYNDATDTWDIIGQTPTGIWLCTGCAWVSGSTIYATGGGEITSFTGTYNALNDKIIKSTDGGVTWSIHTTLPVGMRSMWPETIKYDTRIWFLNGYASGANQLGLWYSEDNGLNWILFSNSIPARHATSLCIHDDSLYIGWGNFHNDLWRIEKIVYPDQGFATSNVQTWWEKNWPADRPTDAMLTAVNTLFNTLNTDLSLNAAKTQLQCLDYVAIVAGAENENQFLLPLFSSNTDYLNGTTKTNGNPTWSSAGATSTNSVGAPYYMLNWRPDVHAVKYSLNSASFFEYTLNNVTCEDFEYGNSASYMVSHSADFGGRLYGTCNSGDFAAANVAGKGYKGITRTASNAGLVWIETTSTAFTRVSTVMGASKFSLCGTAVANKGSNILIGFVGIGDKDLDHAKMRTAIRAFFTTRGVSF